MKNEKNNHARKSRKNELGHQGEERKGIKFISSFVPHKGQTHKGTYSSSQPDTHVEYVLTDHKQ